MELQDWKGKSGVYFITPDNLGNTTMWVKVGLGRSLNHRLDSYLLYYPHGFHVLCLFHTSRRNAPKVEKVIHDVLRRKIRQMDTNHSHSGEWFRLSKKDITTLYTALMNMTPNFILKEKSVLLTKKPWRIQNNNRPVNQTRKLVLNNFALRLYNEIHGMNTVKRPRQRPKDPEDSENSKDSKGSKGSKDSSQRRLSIGVKQLNFDEYLEDNKDGWSSSDNSSSEEEEEED